MDSPTSGYPFFVSFCNRKLTLNFASLKFH